MDNKTTSDDARSSTVAPSKDTTKARTDAPSDAAQAAYEAALCASPKPRVTVRQQTVRFPNQGAAAPIVRLLKALGCPLSPEAERWLHHEDHSGNGPGSDRDGDLAERAGAAQ